MIRCVGEPDRRFGEDALRVMRALRFAACFGFSIGEETARSLRRSAPGLRRIAAERLREEMTKLLCGDGAAAVLLAYPEVIGVFLPEILPPWALNSTIHTTAIPSGSIWRAARRRCRRSRCCAGRCSCTISESPRASRVTRRAWGISTTTRKKSAQMVRHPTPPALRPAERRADRAARAHTRPGSCLHAPSR